MKLEDNLYVIQNIRNFSLSTFMKAMKSRYDALEGCLRDNPTFHEKLVDFISEEWENIEPLTFKEAFQEENQEKKRVLFSCLGPERLFKEVDPILLDKQTIKKKRICWDENNNKLEKEFEDTYELYKVDSEKLGITKRSIGIPYNSSMYVVRCWCTTTGREYWLFVPKEIAGFNSEPSDAIGAIAWTIQIGIKNPKRIYRQGDVIIVEPEGKPEFNKNWSGRIVNNPLTKEEYLNLMYSET